ncbi:hypothetical protein N0V88_003295 [Collariella sp. IMI 366227]|nr:hypothetical protein N0V88_003295 [Collariella sp. IMI 366227]
MSSLLPSLRGFASSLLTRPTTSLLPSSTLPQCATISTTSAVLAGPKAKGGKPAPKAKANPNKTAKKSKRGDNEPRDPKMINMLSHFAILSPNRIPPPLRMARNRHLRHWTIHRAWLLFRRREREAREKTLMRQWQSMDRACEALRLTSGPGTRDEGYLYRVAMEKKGIYGLNGVPIEYARAQTETPARMAWNHEWKR